MNVNQYLDSTYLKTAQQAQLSEKENTIIALSFVQEAIEENFKLIMIRPELVLAAKKMIVEANSKVLVGTVIDFPEGISDLNIKLAEAQKAIDNQVDELDFVINYHAFITNEIESVKKEIIACTNLGLKNKKVVKFIIEVAALTNQQIIKITVLIKNTIIANFKEENYSHIFIKSSTGFYKTQNDKPNGVTRESIVLMLENANPLSVKAAGGVRDFQEAKQMINLGVKRIGTSSAKLIVRHQVSQNNY